MKRLVVFLYAVTALLSVNLKAQELDSLRESIVVSAPKDLVPLRQTSISSTTFHSRTIEDQGIHGVKDLSSLAPNLFIPRYGSRLTTSAYIRGIGSRTGSSPIGMYIDGIPVLEKSSFDFNLVDIERIDVLRGPQGTIYGRNTMGGLIRIFTKDPRFYEGTDLKLGAALNGSYDASIMHYHHPSEKIAFSGGFSFNHDGGFYRNAARDNEKIDAGNDFGAKLRAIVTPSSSTKYDFNLSYGYTDQGGYPYFYGEEIAYNRRSSYKRHVLNAGLNAEHEGERLVFTSVTGFQFLDDEMNMDQDFTPVDLYSLIQRQNSKQLSEELTLKNKGHRWQWITGVSLGAQWLDTEGPVTFHQDGIDWLNSHVNTYGNAFIPKIESGPMTMSFELTDNIQGSELVLDGLYKTPTVDLAVFHQSDFNDLFGVKGLKATLGIRFGYERRWLDYSSHYSFSHIYTLTGNLTMPQMSRTIPMIPGLTFDVDRPMDGKLDSDSFEILPKASLQYGFGRGSNVYASVSRGYRSGGYNVQMFGEFMQKDMQNQMMADIASSTIAVMENVPSIPAAAKTRIAEGLGKMANPEPIDIESLVKYDPEHAWSYELGTHLNLFKGKVVADLSAFWIDTQDLQLSRMAESGLGRVTVNAGTSRSLGAEASVQAQVTDGLSFHAAYGFTDARFRDERTTYVPFSPRNTLDAGATYSWNMKGWLDCISLGADWHGVGRIYWNEENDAWQDFYGVADARLTFRHASHSLSLWASNLTSTSAQAFWFESMSKAFYQKMNPFQAGIELRLRF